MSLVAFIFCIYIVFQRQMLPGILTDSITVFNTAVILVENHTYQVLITIFKSILKHGFFPGKL